ncbi:MAG: hypothetical protein IJ087_00900 [Eggerthellaceae bacterium]|nr:hypothetical protein [Eggerthellaceae bacterium]
MNARPGSLLEKNFEGGCGIESGIYSLGFPITINGGTVQAQGGEAAAGIGGTMSSSEAS